MAFLDRIRECNAHRLAEHLPLRTAQGVRVGYVRRDRVVELPPEMRDAAGRPLLPGDDESARTAVLAELAAALAARGSIGPLRGELYPVWPRVSAPRLAVVDRAAVPWLGIASAGVHVNVLAPAPAADGGPVMWIAHRARDKSTFPGMLDNAVAGGQPYDLGLFENVVKECGEEAGIPPELARRARSVGAISYVFENSAGLKPDTMFCYDLTLPPDFTPRAVDGEVERFELLPVADVAALVRDSTRFKFNCNLVVIDFLVRHGLLDSEAADYVDITSGLHRRLSAPGSAAPDSAAARGVL